MNQWIAGQVSPEVVVNEDFATLAHQAVYGKRQSATTGLTWGYYGGRWGGLSVADGTFTLTASNTNYIVVAVASGVSTCSTSATNWNDATNYVRVYKLTTSGSAVTAEEDHRAGPGGVHGGAGGVGSGGTELKGLTFTSDTGSTADSDPGAGLFKWNNATQASATFLYFDNTTADSISLTTFYASLGSSGFIYLQQGDDSTKWQLWKWTSAPTNGTGYYKFPVSLQASGGSIVDNKTVYADFSGLGSSTVGTVTASGGSLTSNAVVLGAGTTDTKVVAGITTDGTSALNLGVAGASVGKVVLANATSGSVTVQSPTGALGTVTLTLPAATDTLVGKATTDTLTNKTLTNSIVGTQSANDNSTKAASTAYVDTKATPVLIQLACSDETTALTTGVAKATFRAPYAFTLTDVRASVTTAPTGGTLLTVDVNESGTTVLSTKLTFDASEKTTTTAATPRVISDSAIADDAEITIDIDAVGSTIAGAGLKVTLIGTKP